MKKRKLFVSLFLSAYALSFLTIDNALGLYINSEGREKVFNINATVSATKNIKRFYVVTYNWWNNGSTVGQYLYLFNSSTSTSDSTFPGNNIKDTTHREIVWGEVSNSADNTSNECKYYFDVDMDLYDSFILTRALISAPTTGSNQYNQTVDIKLDESYDTYYINNDETTTVSSKTRYQYSTNMKNLYVRTKNSEWGINNADVWIYLLNNTGNFSKKMITFSTGSTYSYYWYYVDFNKYTTCIICRMNPSGGDTFSWDNKWNQTSDITLDSSKNYILITGWNAGSYTSTIFDPNNPPS